MTDEKLAVALLAGGGEGPYLYLSKLRLNLVRKTTQDEEYKAFRRHLRALQKKVNSHRNENSGILLFDPLFSTEQMEKLAQHAKDAISFSKPVTINDWLDKSKLSKLVEVFFKEEFID